MMDMNLNSYIRTQNVFSKKFCGAAVKNIRDIEWSKHNFYEPNKKKEIHISGDKELSVGYARNVMTDSIMDKLHSTIHKYIIGLKMKEWFDGWTGYSLVRYNQYEVGQTMAIHCDHIYSLFTTESDKKAKGIPVLSIIGVLNDDYEGGELMFHDKEYETKTGDVIIFPSSFLYPHMVKPVTKGTRYSFVSWVY